VLIIFAGVKGYLDKISVNDVTKFESFLLEQMKDKGKDIINKIEKEQSINDQLENEINTFLEKVVADFLRGTDAKS
jgi:F-type H+-transporting ATPase subunit alpha